MPPSEIGQAPQQTAGHRAAKLAVIILSVLIILALIGLVAGIILKTGKKPAASVAASVDFQIPAGMRVRQMATQPGRLILHLENEDGDEIVILDTDDGHLVRRIRAAP